MISYSNCYSLEAVPAAPALRAEFGLGPLRTWLDEFPRMKLQRAVPRLIVKLDRMSRVAMSATVRRNLLREIEKPLSKAAAALPKPVSGEQSRHQRCAYTLLLEQQLYCAMVKNLKQVLVDLDESTNAFGAEANRRRRWTLRKLFRFLGLQIELGLFGGWPLPPHTWQELHDLYSYVVERGITVSGRRSRRVGTYDFDPEREYKRLLVLGLAGRFVRHQTWCDFVRDRIECWVADTKLETPDSFVGEVDLYVVDTSKDTPPRQLKGALGGDFRGWILVRPSGFLSDAMSPEVETAATAYR